MERFRLVRPGSLDEAVEILAGAPETARPIAGGTSVVPLWKEGLLPVETLVDLSGIEELRGVRVAGAEVRIGAAVTLGEVEDADLARRGLPLLHQSVRVAANRRIREMATLGGALCQGDPASDVCAGALASAAVLHVVGPGGPRSVESAAFFRGLYETDLAPGELLVRACLPAAAPELRCAYLKFSPRSRYDRPAVGVAVAWREQADGSCLDVRVAFSGAASVPFRCRPAEAALEGRRPDEAAVSAAAEAAYGAVDPLADLRGSAEYKREMARVFLGRAVRRARDGADSRGVAS